MKNLEVKYRVSRLEQVVEFLSCLPEVQKVWQRRQKDRYYSVPTGRLKLRREDGAAAQLIFYRREDAIRARESEYQIYRSENPAELDEILKRALGVFVTVKKERTLFLFRNVRIHLDRVEQLGDFVEFESVVDARFDEETARRNLEEILDKFRPFRLISVAESYSDLLLRAESGQ